MAQVKRVSFCSSHFDCLAVSRTRTARVSPVSSGSSCSLHKPPDSSFSRAAASSAA